MFVAVVYSYNVLLKDIPGGRHILLYIVLASHKSIFEKQLPFVSFYSANDQTQSKILVGPGRRQGGGLLYIPYVCAGSGIDKWRRGKESGVSK